MTADPATILREALDAGADPLEALARFRAAQTRFHAEFAASEAVSCARGCSACCSQMVFDVTAVEVEDLGRFLRSQGIADAALARLRSRRDLWDAIRLDTPRRAGEDPDEWTERLALAFWARGLDCAFLAADGSCGVFDHRPQSCRRFFVHGPAELCTPASAADPRRRARMVEPGAPDEVDRLLRQAGDRVGFDPEDDRLDHAMVRWLENRSDR